MVLRVPFLLLAALPLFAAEISTIAGTGKAGYSGDGGKATEADLNQPFGVITAPDGDVVFCDTNNHVIRRIARETGIISTIVGSGKKGYAGDGEEATKALLDEPYEIRFHPGGDLFWVERLSHTVRKMDAKTGLVSTVAGTGKAGFSGDGGPADQATMHQPHSIEFDPEGKSLFICDIKNHRIRRVDLALGTISTFCGTGTAAATPDGAEIGEKTPLNGPRALGITPDGSLWLATREGNQIFRMDLEANRIHHIAGTGKKGFTGNGGPAKKATLSGPKGIAVSPDGKLIYLADTESHTVRAIDLTTTPPSLLLIAGTGKKGDGPDSPDPLKCAMARLHGIGVDPENGDLYIGDSETHKVRVVKSPGR